ncbi:probable aspartyl aminopeptidase isoform X1 [Mangifera indica]|uniref:probable aspartyl aminopeptidase isoform X1 n=2 Tax=Mangifera indica TaxID=29780 RepID=UPI001CFB2DA9|nr:probable aspartyl aminopeptidase isoform X1 [Mangifera indica]XP_044460714.1 probable aspartyl aminopeptidase isoform X1 [Mangifera indica]
MATAAITLNRLQLLHIPSPIIARPSIYRAKITPSRNTRSFPCSLHNFSTTTHCSRSDSIRTASQASSTSGSIVGHFLDYLNESWTPFHATAEAKRLLIDAGFNLLNENEEWELKPGGRYFFTRNMSSLVAFAVGEKYSVGDAFHVIAAHTDSPCLKIKPKSASSKSGYLMVNVQTYGGGLWHTWFDRDLSVAGRVIVRGSDGSFLHKLVKVERPLLRVPTLAIHLDRAVNKDGFKPNLETHLIPLLATKSEEASPELKEKSSSSSKAAHHPVLMQILSEELSCEIDDIVSIELNICDTQPSCLGGANNEFIFSGRLDNLASSYCALRALIDSCGSPSDLSSEHAIRMVALFDNEEVGSDSYQGAGAPTMFQAIRRIVGSLAQEYTGESAYDRSIRQSFLVSADMAHGVHPNFSEKHEENHRPEMHKGLVIKHNANQRYATSGVTAFLFKEIAKIHNLPTQEFVVRNDMGCGSTIGPILASGVGIRTVDCGIPQLSMHSVREICGKEDVDIAYKHFKAFYKTFSSIDKKLIVDYYREGCSQTNIYL